MFCPRPNSYSPGAETKSKVAKLWKIASVGMSQLMPFASFEWWFLTRSKIVFLMPLPIFYTTQTPFWKLPPHIHLKLLRER